MPCGQMRPNANSEDHAPAAPPPFVCVLGTSSPAMSTFAEAVESCLHDLESNLIEVGCVLDDVVNVRTYLPSYVMTIPGYAACRPTRNS